MLETPLMALLIMSMRICDVTIGTIRTILVVQGRKYLAAAAGFTEVLIWIFAIRFVMQHLDNIYNFIGYASGFAIGNIVGITLDQKIGLGHVEFNIISRFHTDAIADALRSMKYGLTIIPGEGTTGGVSVILLIAPRKQLKSLMKTIESIDKTAFITIQHSVPYRGFIHGSRK